jgi:ABC-type transporter Mla subunit MlaD
VQNYFVILCFNQKNSHNHCPYLTPFSFMAEQPLERPKSGITTEVKVGAVTVVSLLLLLGGIFVGKGILARTSFTAITMRSSSSGGLEIASSVLVNGVRRGSVTAITPVQGGVVITADIDNIRDLRSDAVARIMILELTGGRKIEITPGISTNALTSRDTIRGVYTGDIADLISLVGEVGPDLTNIVRRLDTIVTVASDLLADGKVSADVRGSLKSLREVAETANVLVQSNKGNIQTIANDLTTTTQELRRAVTINSPKVSSLVEQLDSTLVEARRLVKSGDRTIGNVDGVVRNIDALLADARDRDNIIHKIIYDAEFSKQLDSTILSLKRFIQALPQDGVNVNVRLGTRP